MPHKPKILIVDDEPANRKLLADVVGREDSDVVTASGGAEALAVIARESIDLVLLDLMMPEVDGMAVLAELKRRGVLPALPIVVVTALEERKVRIDALAAGAIDFLTKPIDRVEITCKVRTLIELKRLRDAAEMDAAAVRAQLRAVLDNAPDFVVSTDRSGVIQYVNRGLPPYTAEQVVGSSWVSRASTAEEREIRRVTLEGVFATGASAYYETSAPGVDGSPLHFESHIGPVRLGEDVVGAVIITRDVTEKKRTDLQLMISDRMTSIGTLAAGVAHEINNPLAVAMANVDLALADADTVAKKDGGREIDDVRKDLRDARDAIERIRLIVRDMRIFSRQEDDIRKGSVDVGQVLESTLRMAWNEIRHRARLVKDYGKIPLALANEARLGQVFLNLVLNAAQAIPEGDAAGNEIRVVTSVDPTGRVQVEIRDTGPGIPPEVLGRLFTPFFTTKPAGVGTGLGLSISHRLVTALGGEIQVESQVGKGTTLRVLLPSAAVDAVEERSAPPAPQQQAFRRGRILVIDDEPKTGQAVRRTLAKEHDVTVVERGQEALDLLLAGGNPFDVILCDLMMPQMTGMDLYEQLRSNGGAALASGIIFLTGGAFTKRAREFLEQIPNLHVEKPFDTRHLRALVNERLR